MTERWVRLDRWLGLRAWGLILYGVLPSNLSMIGLVSVSKKDFAGPDVLLVLGLIVPIAVTFLLIRQRHAAWYLTTDRLFARSALTTGLILAIATGISGVAGIANDQFTFRPWPPELGPALRPFATAVASLVLSSTLFMAVITKDAAFPGLPPKYFVGKVELLRTEFLGLSRGLVPTYPGDAQLDRLIDFATNARTISREMATRTDGLLIRRSLVKPGKLLESVEEILKDVEAQAPSQRAARWNSYLADEKNLTDGEKTERAKHADRIESALALTRMKLGAKDV